MKKSFLILLSAMSFAGTSQTAPTGGRTCGTGVLPQQFESWFNSLPQPVSGPKLGGGNIQSVFNIPVIVHIIHNNESLNSPSSTTGANLNAAQVIDQINILNKDYNGTNTDTTLIPSVFKPSFGKMQVNFCLAVVNPTGGVLAEPGIDRVNRSTKGWTAPPYSQTYIDATIKPNSIWDPNRYLNIWVCGLSSGLLGYATFPSPGASGVTGLGAPFGSITSDGVVILNTSFGSVGTAQFGQYNKGRTATHEIGHWMGLRHIWGDGTCATDYCNDTPPAQTANYNCPSFPYKLGTCAGNTTGEMTMNYMDYTNDACMYMFTKDQKIRSQLILSYSPMRAALITSSVCNLPTAGLDPGISSVVAPTYTQNITCINYINPVINITNYGSVVLNSLTVSYNVDAVNTQTMNWTGTANPNTTFTIGIPQIANLSNGAHTFSVNISNPNGSVDVNLNNNNNVQNFTIANVLTVSVNSASTCSGAPVTLTATGGTSYNWNNLGNTSTITVSPQTTTVYSVTITNGACNVVKTSTVTVIPGPSLSITNASVCAGVQATLSASGASSYTWSTGSNNTSISVSNSVTTQYTVSGSVPNGCTSNLTATLSILPSPTLAVNNVSTCPGITTTLSATGASSYTWSTGSNNSNVQVSPNSTTIYTVSGSVNGCVSSQTVNVIVGNVLSVFIAPSFPKICTGGSVTLTAGGAGTYSWSNGSQNAAIVVSPTVTTSYTVGGLTSNCPGFQVVTVTVNTLPTLNLVPFNVKCFGNSTGSITASATGNGPFQLTYSSGSVNLPAGTYTVGTSDVNGCTASGTINISEPSALQSNASTADTKCPGSCDGLLQIVPSGGVGPYTATVYPVFISGLTYSTLCAGNFTYYITDNNGCVQFNNVTINAGNAGVAIGTTVTNVSCASCADATLFAGGQSGIAPYVYLWQPGGFNTAVVNNVAAGCYTVNVKDAQGCNSDAVTCVVFDVGINEIEKLNNIVLAPNPAHENLFISGLPAGIKTIAIYDAQGKLIRSLSTENSNLNFSCSEFSNGIYLIRVNTENAAGTLRFLKQD